ncbi:MAG: putative eukaryotic snRNP-like RNA-binding protein [halophilic archaeon J07HX64]|jgi:Predicted RNA-binding protein homologous to eukaryotic snRNP|nr:MAG: putative eukaryotic snRNP-like RNA-binding protein [halophilic archaeon J07HX64]
MEQKRELTSVDLAALAGELAAYEGARVDKAYLYPDGLVRLKLRSFDRGRVELLVDLGATKHVRVADPDNVPAAPERPPNFAMMMRNRIEGAELVGVEQFEFDRILSFRFERDDGTTTLVAELFGDGNLAVLDGTDEVVDSLETVRLKSRTVAPGARYEFPDARFDPLATDRDTFAERFAESDADVVRTLATQFNFGGTWAEELCTRADVEKTLDVAAVDDTTIDRLYATVGELGARLRGGDLDPRVYRDGSDSPRVDVTPVPMRERAGFDANPFDSFTGALDDYYTSLDEETEPAGSDRPEFEAEIEKRKRIIEQQRGAIESFEQQAAAERETAQSLYANYDLVDEVLTTVRTARDAGHSWDDIAARFEHGAEQGIDAAQAVDTVDGSEGTVTLSVDDRSVTLRVRDGVEKNADRIYQEAKRIEEKKQGAEAAIENTRTELESVRAERDAWERGDADDSGQDTAGDTDDETVDWLSRSSVPVRQTDRWYEQFRWFHTSDDFLVIGGRNADQNEAIVKKYLDRGDLFFHAQAHGGPVTVLKATGPSESYDDDIEVPDRSKQEAARFAVSYSSVWKASRYTGDAYMVDYDQVSKTPESGEYLEKGGFAVRGDRTYFENVAVGVTVGITCEPETRVIGGPSDTVEERAETSITVEPGKYAQNDIGKRLYREFKTRFADETFVRKVASPDLIQEFLPPGQSSMVE